MTGAALPARGRSFLLQLPRKFLPTCLFRTLCNQLLDILLVLFLGFFRGGGWGVVCLFACFRKLAPGITILTFLKEVKKRHFCLSLDGWGAGRPLRQARGSCCWGLLLVLFVIVLHHFMKSLFTMKEKVFAQGEEGRRQGAAGRTWVSPEKLLPFTELSKY